MLEIALGDKQKKQRKADHPKRGMSWVEHYNLLTSVTQLLTPENESSLETASEKQVLCAALHSLDQSANLSWRHSKAAKAVDGKENPLGLTTCAGSTPAARTKIRVAVNAQVGVRRRKQNLARQRRNLHGAPSREGCGSYRQSRLNLRMYFIVFNNKGYKSQFSSLEQFTRQPSNSVSRPFSSVLASGNPGAVHIAPQAPVRKTSHYNHLAQRVLCLGGVAASPLDCRSFVRGFKGMRSKRAISTLLREIKGEHRECFCSVHILAGNDRFETMFSDFPKHAMPSGHGADQDMLGRVVQRPRVYYVPFKDTCVSFVSLSPDMLSEVLLPIFHPESGLLSAVVNLESPIEAYWAPDGIDKCEKATVALSVFLALHGKPDPYTLISRARQSWSEADPLQTQCSLQAISASVLKAVAEEPSLLFTVSPRRFEEIIAELLAAEGYAVQLTPQQKDGGRDILAIMETPVGQLLTLVECKRWAPHKPVSVEIVRGLYGVLHHERASHVMIATTSRFTKDARDFQSAVRYQMSLKDYDEISQWLRKTYRS